MNTNTFDVTIIPINATYAKLRCDSDTLMEISEAFTYDVVGAKYSPAYKSGQWDGRKHMVSNLTGIVYIGLVDKIIQYCKDAGYSINNEISEPNSSVTLEIIEKFCNSLNLHSKDKPINIREYQVDAVYQAIKNNRLTLLSPTSSGKSLIIYCILRWYSLSKKKMLLLVPNIGLVSQMFSDFEDYSSDNGWNTNNNVHCVTAGKDKVSSKSIILSTWQSLYNIGKGSAKGGQLADGVPKEYFQQFSVLINDEVHLARGNSITGIAERCTNANIRFGLTGTLNDVDVDKLVIEGLFGSIHKVITTAELMEAGDVTKLYIKCLKVNYTNEVKKNSTKLTYQEEMDFLVSNHNRNKFICKLALSQTENVVIFFGLVQKHGKVLYEILTEMCGDSKKVLYIDGDVGIDEREDIRKMIATRNDLILLGSYQSIGTGTNIPNLHVGIFASPAKSKIRIIQTIGRMLRLNVGKEKCTMYDIVDDICWKSHKNYTFDWFLSRVSYYCEQRFNYKIIEVPVGMV